MTISVPSAGIKGYALLDWYTDLEDNIIWRTKFDYQVEIADLGSTSGTVDYSLNIDQGGLYVCNPGTVTLPPISLTTKGQSYFFVSVRNSAASAAFAGGDKALVVGSGSDTVGHGPHLVLIGLRDAITDVTFSIFVTSDGVSNWVVHR